MIGEQVANFRILEKLGEGGMGVVYKGLDVHLERMVAIKMLSPELARNPELVDRFRTEARAQANLNHVNLATLYAFLVEDGNAFIVMEFVEGETFEQLIRRRGPLPPEDAIPWFKQALLGIGAAHRMGIVHRDIKPTNLMLNRQGIVKVMDFGIAKVLGARSVTRTGTQLGTPSYMAPEQIQNRPIDVRTDIYALGMTLYQMLSGHLPFEEGSDFEIMTSQCTAAPPPMTRMYPYAPTRYQSVVEKAIEKDPSNRYQSVEEFGAALEQAEKAGSPIVVGAAPAPKPTMIETSSNPGSRAPVAPASQPNSATAAAGQDSAAPTPQLEKSGGWNSRYTMAAVAVGAAVVLLAAVLFAHKSQTRLATANPTPSGTVAPVLTSSGPQVGMKSDSPDLGLGLTPKGNLAGSASPENSVGHSAGIVPTANKAASSAPAKRASGLVAANGSQAVAGSANAPAPNDPPANPPAASKDLDEVEHQVDQLTTRASAVNSSLDTLKNQQAAAGYGLRGDVASRQSSLQLNLSKAQNAVEHGDVARAKKYAEQADADLEFLEHFLGH
jgi:eukaryotic-like serine/threonine-protein kinase